MLHSAEIIFPGMRCLNCNSEMVNYDVTTKKTELSYDICEKCGSLWLDAGELDKMAFQVTGSIEFCSEEKDETPEKQAKNCPRCDGVALSRVRFLGETDIILHHCTNCGGFWLDGGELNLIDNELAKIMPVSGHGFSEFVNNVHVPYWYKRIRKDSSETDFKAVVEPIRGARHLNPTADRCPVDGTNLDLYSIHSMEMEGCPKCHGMWLARDQLRKLKNKFDQGQLHWLNDEVDNIESAAAIPSNRSCAKGDSGKLLSVVFGKSSIIIDWCPICHGLWLDRAEFDAIMKYLDTEIGNASRKEIEKEIVEDLKKLWIGGPESRVAEVGDIAAAILALANFTIIEHPALLTFVTNVAQSGRSIGMD
jgi:Zn-finger nucleic acid-binding protein